MTELYEVVTSHFVALSPSEISSFHVNFLPSGLVTEEVSTDAEEHRSGNGRAWLPNAVKGKPGEVRS